MKIEYEKLWNIIKDYKLKFRDNLIKYFGDHLTDSLGYLADKQLSINEYCPSTRFGNKQNEKTVFITTRIFDIWENAVYEEVKKILQLENGDINKVSRWTTSEGDLKYFNEIWEIKSSQARDSWTGSTHSDLKSNNYVLINYQLNMEEKMWKYNNIKILKAVGIFLLQTSEKIDWIGEPSHKSSFTTLKIKNEWKEKGYILEIAGTLMPRQKYCKINHFIISDENK